MKFRKKFNPVLVFWRTYSRNVRRFLHNNDFKFNGDHEILGTAMGRKWALSYDCLTIGYKEEEILFKEHLPNYFSLEEIGINKKIWKKYFDDGLLPCSSNLNFDIFAFCVNNLHLSITVTFENAKRIKNENGRNYKSLIF